MATRKLSGASYVQAAWPVPTGAPCPTPSLCQPDASTRGHRSVLCRGAEAHGEGRDVDQDVWPGSQPGALGRQTSSCHAIMPVRMGAPSAGPRLEHPDHPEPAAAAPWLHRQCRPGLRGAPQAEVVAGVLVATGQGAACHRARQGQQDVRDRPPQPRVVVAPWRGLVLLARGTGPVLTGVVAVMGRVAGRTVIDRAGARLRAARRHIRQGPPMPGPPPVATCGTGRGAMEAEHRRVLPPHRSAMTRWRAAAPRCAALAVRGVETRVVVGERCPRDAYMRRRWTPAASPGVAQACRRVGTEAWVWRPLSLRASRHVPGPRLLGLGAVAVDRACPPRPGAGKRRTG